MTSESRTTKKQSGGVLASLQRIGRSLMLPIAALPAAGILLRIGQADMLGKDGLGQFAGWLNPVADIFAAAGNALFGNLALIFALGVAVGFAKKSEGATALAAFIGIMVFQGVGNAVLPYLPYMPGYGGEEALVMNYGVLGGIIMGVIAALLYDKYYRIKLPTFLAFFGGRRFVPIITAAVAVVVGVVLALVYPFFAIAFNAVGEWITNPSVGVFGAFVYGFANRMLIPFGLHHILNSFPWFMFGSFTAADGVEYQGDIARFLHHDPTAGTFMTGFFPILMFALPAAALAMWHAARPENRKAVGGVMISTALTAFITGITEPIEFSFVYVAFPLYVVHAVLTGSSLALCNALGIKDGFSFSAGGTDLLLNWGIATKPWLLVIIGLIYAAVYYVLFRILIKVFNMKTPGREDEGAEAGNAVQSIIDQDMTPTTKTEAGATGAARAV
ncbi:MAG: PTS transporter subunit EIIC [Propionibacteriaceae bacterium]|jgi:PTS system N-acetylglucosamine-specific IIC component|nr:PTS transporter subunit EIIC [Propionibacteriaceae bacterium]